MRSSLFAMAAVYVTAGLFHLSRPGMYLPAMPPYLPYPEPLILISGLIQIGLGLLLLWPRTRRYAARGIVALLIAVFPANVQMARTAATTWPNVPPWLLFSRLPVQGLLIWWPYRFTGDESLRARN